MKKKTILGVSALTGLLLLAATGCEKTQQPPVKTPTQNQSQPSDGTDYVTPNLGGKKLNVYINYKAYSGVSFVGKKMTTYTNPIDGQTYVEKDILPMWKQIQTDLNCVINDAVYDFATADGYTKESDDAIYTALSGDANFGNIDLFLTNSASASKFNANGQLVNLYDYLDYMPNFKQFLLDHPTVASEMTNSAGQLYMLPYFDGLDSPEKMFLMNTELVEWLLDDDAKLSGDYDNTTAKDTAYKAFVDTSKDQKVLISVNGKAEEMTIKAAKNPVTAQNELAVKNGKTYVEALKAYIDAAYMPSGKYAKRSEVFTSEHACYTVDDMVALMRCAVNNSVYLYGTANKVQGLIPRQSEKSRIDSILYFAQAWGVRGLTSEKEYMYFDNNGKIQDARIQQSTYDALGYLHDLYKEGLIIDSFADDNKVKYATTYLTGKEDAALLMYDYNATQTVNNKIDANGLGTKDSIYNGVMPVLPPLTKWAEDNINGVATGGKGYALTRYTEDARSNKGSGTVIPTYEGKSEEQIIAACKLADYFYSPEGADLQDFGPKGVNAKTGKAYTEGEITVNGIVEPKYSSTIINEINNNEAKLGWNDYFRVCVGTTQGIGHVRSDAVDYQVTHASGQIGLKNLLNAVQSGAVVCAITTRNPGFGAMVPSQWASSPSKDVDKYAALSTFFTRNFGSSGWRSVVVKGWDEADTSQTNLKAVWEDVKNIYLQHYQTLFDNRN